MARASLLVGVLCCVYGALLVQSLPAVEVQVHAKSGEAASMFTWAGSSSVAPSHVADTFAAVLSYIKVNDQYIVFSRSEGAWQASPMIALFVRQAVAPMFVKVHFTKQSLDFRIRQSAIGHVAIRPSKSSTNTHVVALGGEASATTMSAAVDLEDAKDRIQNFSTGSHTVRLRLESPLIKEPLVITLGEIDLPSAEQPLGVLQLRDLGEGTLWSMFIDRCDTMEGYEELLETRLWWSELIIALFSVGYCAAVHGLGPLDFTVWQQRVFHCSLVASGAFQILFALWKTETLAICEVFPLALGVGVVYFFTFNLTNVLILCEYSLETDADAERSNSDTPTLRRQRANAGRTFDSIPTSTQLQGMTRVVMVGAPFPQTDAQHTTEMTSTVFTRVALAFAFVTLLLASASVSAHAPRGNAARERPGGFHRPGRHGQAVQSIEFNGITVLHEDLLHSLRPVQEKLDVTTSGIRVAVRFQFSEMTAAPPGGAKGPKPSSHGSISVIHNETKREVARTPLQYGSGSRSELRGHLTFAADARRAMRKACANATCTAQILINNRGFGRSSAIELGKLRFYSKKTNNKSGIRLLTYPRLVDSAASGASWESYALALSAVGHFFLLLGAGLMLLVGSEAWRALILLRKDQQGAAASKRWLQLSLLCSVVYLGMGGTRLLGFVEMADVAYAAPAAALVAVVALCITGGPADEYETLEETQDEDYIGEDEADAPADAPTEETKKTN